VELAAFTATYYALTYLGFGAPYLFALAHGALSYPAPLVIAARLPWQRRRRSPALPPLRRRYERAGDRRADSGSLAERPERAHRPGWRARGGGEGPLAGDARSQSRNIAVARPPCSAGTPAGLTLHLCTLTP
jgi:hypothetical protein